MELLNFSEIYKTILFTFGAALLITVSGSYWIDRLYKKVYPSDLLSFPENIAARSRFRKPLLFLLLASCIGKAWIGTTPPSLLYFIIAIAILSFITVTDFEQYVIFDVMLAPFALCGLCYTVHLHLPLWEHIGAGIGGGLLFFILTLLTKGAIGGGDIKLIATLGFWLGVRPLASVIAYGFVTAGIAALFLLITKQKSRHSYFAYGPYFALSGIGMLLGWIRAIF